MKAFIYRRALQHVRMCWMCIFIELSLEILFIFILYILMFALMCVCTPHVWKTCGGQRTLMTQNQWQKDQWGTEKDLDDQEPVTEGPVGDRGGPWWPRTSYRRTCEGQSRTLVTRNQLQKDLWGTEEDLGDQEPVAGACWVAESVLKGDQGPLAEWPELLSIDPFFLSF